DGALEGLYQLLDPLVVRGRRQLEQRARGRRGGRQRGVVAAVRDDLREEGVQEAARGGGRRGVRAREGEVDGRGAAALPEEFVEGLAQELRDAGLRRGQDEEALLARLRRGERGYLARLFAAPDENFGRRAREYP